MRRWIKAYLHKGVGGLTDKAKADWKRERPLMVKRDNYSVHKSQTVVDAVAGLEAADIFLIYLPSYSPELSEIEPVCNDVKHHHLPTRSHTEVLDLKGAVDKALQEKAEELQQAQTKTKNFHCMAA